MNLSEIMNADVGVVGQWIRQGFAWWVDELVQMAPAALRERGANRSRVLAEISEDGAAYRLWKDGAVVAESRGAVGRRQGVDVGLADRDVLVREIETPAMSLNDVRRLVANDIDRLTPFSADAVYADVEIASRNTAEGRQTARVGVTPRAVADRLVSQAQALGLDPRALRSVGEAGVAFDFLPQMRAGRAMAAGSSRRAVWWGVAGVLLAANLVIFVTRDVLETRRISDAVDAQRPTAAVALRLERRVEGERARRAALLDRRLRNDPLRVINGVAAVLPQSAWVQRLVWNGKAVRISGAKDPAFDLVGAMNASPIFTKARAMPADASTAAALGRQPYDVMADVRGASR